MQFNFLDIMAKDRLMALHRLGYNASRKNIPLIPGIITRLIRLLYSFDLPSTAEIGEGTVFRHNGLGCVVHHHAKIGKNCNIYQNVSIAGRNGRGVPVIGNDVLIGCGACVLGGGIIGDGAKIGAMSLVIEDVPPYSTVVGIPAKIVKREQV